MKKLGWVAFTVLKYVAPLALVVLWTCSSFGKRKDDVVIMKNGDKFTGEIKALQYGELTFKSSYMKDDVHLDWKEVKTMESQDTFIVGLSDGKRVPPPSKSSFR